MTARGAIVLLLFGVLLSIVGGLFKLQHWPYAGELLLGASLVQALAVLTLLIKVWNHPGAKEFLDR
jgi:hypothetical protein